MQIFDFFSQFLEKHKRHTFPFSLILANVPDKIEENLFNLGGSLMSFLSTLSDFTVDGISLWALLLVTLGVFFAGFVDSIAGGGGIISVPAYLMAFHGLPTYYVLGTNKLSSCLGTAISAARFVRSGLVDWVLFTPAVFLSVLGSVGGTWLQHRTPDIVLKYLLLAILPIVAFFTLRSREWPDEPGQIDPRRQKAIVWAASLLIGCYDGYYGPGTGTFLMIVLIRLGRLDTRHAAGGVKIVNLASNIGGVVTALLSGYVLVGVGLIASLASIAGHYLGAGLAIKNGSRLVRPAVTGVLLLLTLKIASEIFFPSLWS